MPWKETSLEKTAQSLGISIDEVRAKQELMHLIVKAREDQELSQNDLAKKVGVTQSRIAQIESGVGTAKVSFDVLLNILCILGFRFKIITKKAA